MKYVKYLFLVQFTLMMVTMIGCKSSTEPEDVGTGEGDAIINGVVLDNSSDQPLSNANILILEGSQIISRTSNSEGKFAATVSISKITDIKIITILEGFYTDTTKITIGADQEVGVTVRLQERSIGTDVAGDPASVVLVSTSAQSIGVKESGSVESALVTFEVQDSSGNAINIEHSVWVNFSLGQSPGGGEYINPTSVKTNANGRVTVSITSGIKAGVVQFVAEINFNGKIIISKPVNIAIHGGHPDQAHLSVATEYLNIPGWNIDGVTDIISAIVGDKYANPVKPKTAVYFTTTGGIVEGSALTNNLGIGAATLLSGNPRPVHPLYGPGFATVTAFTADENYNEIRDSVVVLFSGYPIITATPTEFPDVSHGGATTIRYTIFDENGNPIAPGNKVSVSILEGESVRVVGDINFTTMDTQSKEATKFSFRVVDDDLIIRKPKRSVSIQISVTGPNGYATTSVSGMVD